jgi:hypothetical protein
MEPKIQEKLKEITYLRINLQNKYGYDKPEELVTESFKNRFKRAYQKFSDSLITDNDALKLSMLDMMTRAYIALQNQLETENIKPTDDNVWRIKHKDGQIIVLCNDKHKKQHYVDKYKDELVMSADEIKNMTWHRGSGVTNYNISLDRKNPLIGYVPDNCQLVCTIVNLMKQSLSDVDFIWWCKSITENNEKHIDYEI